MRGAHLARRSNLERALTNEIASLAMTNLFSKGNTPMLNPEKLPDTSDRELVLTRLIDAPPEKVFRCWTDPELMVKWFTPPPWKTIHVERDLRAGGASLVVMQGPEGQEVPLPGVY